MGNVHEVTQVEPFRSPHGAAIPVRPGARLEGDYPSYVHTGQAARPIGRSRFPIDRTYLIVQTGGKWGYDHDFQAFLAANARALDDAVFYVSDEYAMYVREFRIANGTVDVEFVAPDNSHVGLVLVDGTRHRDFGLQLLEDMLDGMLWGGGDKEEPTSVRFRAVMALVTHRPERWQTWFQLGQLKSDYAAGAALEAYERALALVPREQRSVVEIAQLAVLAKVDPLRALAAGRAAIDRWLADAAKARGELWNRAVWGVTQLAELERAHGVPDAAARLYLAALRANDTVGLGHRLYNLACLHARTDPAKAARWLAVALQLEPALAASAATDPDLASVDRGAPVG